MPEGRPGPWLEPAARPGGGVRWLAHLDPSSEARYRALVGAAVPFVEPSLGREVLANRAVGRGRWATSWLEPWRAARAAWTDDVVRLGGRPDVRAVLVSDVTACYASMSPSVVARRLRRLACPAHVVSALERFLRALGDRGIAGLPVGPTPSAIVANVVLAAADEAIRATGVSHRRWVDDVVVFARDRREAAAASDAFARALDELGLEPNPAKTVLLEDRAGFMARVVTAAGSMTTGSPMR